MRISEDRLRPEVGQPLAHLRRSRTRSGEDAVRRAEQIYRVATTLLDPVQAPAHEVGVCYHERWEVELVYDERQEHQPCRDRVLSRTVPTSMQEMWA